MKSDFAMDFITKHAIFAKPLSFALLSTYIIANNKLPHMNTVYIGLGSNKNNPPAQIKQALTRLRKHPDIHLCACSRWYQSRAITLDDIPQDDYINAVAKLTTQLEPIALLRVLQDIEQQQGRQRLKKWGSRTLDLDILLYNAQVIQTRELIIPHPLLNQRAFVLYPLADIQPDLHIPGQGVLQDLLTQVDSNGLQVIKTNAAINHQ